MEAWQKYSVLVSRVNMENTDWPERPKRASE
ncbi:hypothetical protein [Enterobacter asburiae]